MRNPLLIAASCVLVLSLSLVGTSGATKNATITAALISDIGKFNDKSFNQSQLPLNWRRRSLGVNVIPSSPTR